MNCPHCKSDHCQTLPMIWNSGLSSGSSTGVAYTFGVGATVAQGHSTSVTALAQQAAPPVRPSSSPVLFVLLAAVVVFFLLLALVSAAVSYVVAAIFVFLGIVVLGVGVTGLVFLQKAKEQDIQSYNYWFDIWQKTWMCLRCGTRFNPYQTGPVKF